MQMVVLRKNHRRENRFPANYFPHTIPVAEALLGKGAQLGTILAFMMAVTTLSLPSIIMLRKVMKPLLLGLFVGICVLGIILVGYFFNLFQYFFV